jgi:hypothetical protein
MHRSAMPASAASAAGGERLSAKEEMNLIRGQAGMILPGGFILARCAE